ncbi:polysaccharide deacetylase family protein [Clostridium sp.]|uniref:polysaccharide deacetylase family protein n=1 Tax=Clostridium sp. TaxID=1506 RepID=UPI002616D77C|nr:polysaccharide deacetylase family protein [Clostridium sp.]
MERLKGKINRRKKHFIVLTKLLLCLFAAGIVVSISFNQAIKTYSYDTEEKTVSAYNKDSKEQTTKDQSSENLSMNAEVKPEVQKETKINMSFDGVPLRNDNEGVPVICYHSVSNNPNEKSPIIIPKEKFRQQLQAIKDNGYVTLTTKQLNEYLYKDMPIPVKSVVISFDDGYENNYTEAYPILKELNMTATFFVISNYLDRQSYLNPKEIKEMSNNGMDIESHTASHSKLSDLPYESQIKELEDSKAALENITGKSIIAVAYPEGKYNEDTKKAVLEAGYSMGFTIQRGYADRDDNPAQLNRICIDYTFRTNNILNILKNLKK